MQALTSGEQQHCAQIWARFKGQADMGDMTREPSMEEILSSIRRVIARDESAIAQHVGPQHLGAEDLAETALPADAASDGASNDDVLELTDGAAPDGAQSAMTGQETASATGDILSADSAAASRSALEALASAMASTPSDQNSAGGALTVNAMVEAALRPMLKQWLDANLPAVVERLVATEIARITGGRL
jgi:hypothetical protein